jgi:tRNA-specific 2-thiouridylase
MSNSQTVFVGLSGGVDSSVAALRLINQGYNVVGVFIKVWHPDFMVCNWEAERLDAMRVAAHLNIPFLTCDAEADYRDDVANYFIEEYKAGRTPNPDVMCNQYVKFGAFLRFAKAKAADYIATGHYAQRTEGSDGPELHRGIDTNKDQTYFLWTLSNEQLSYSFFPVGNTKKEIIRAEAEAAGIPTAMKKDSQGICFLGHVDIGKFLSHYIDLKPGMVLNREGEVVGEHDGAIIYTLGQRQGFRLNTNNPNRNAMFVISKDLHANTITVGEEAPTMQSDSNINLSNLVLRKKLESEMIIEAEIRYRQKPFAVKVVSVSDSNLVLSPVEVAELGASGQSCVLYQGEECIGGGIII